MLRRWLHREYARFYVRAKERERKAVQVNNVAQAKADAARKEVERARASVHRWEDALTEVTRGRLD